jgi:DNA repair exonuclease SbcCD ATPase subunit
VQATPLQPPSEARRRIDRLLDKYAERERRTAQVTGQLAEINSYLAVAGDVSLALEKLNEQLFEQLLGTVQEKLSIALQEVLEQPLQLKATAEFKRGGATVEFFVERGGAKEDILRGQGGSVANILSVGLRMFALTTLDEARHRRFLVLDEQDCWLRPDLVPKLVKLVHDAGRALGFQVLMISHHDVATFERYADRIFQLVPGPEGVVEVRRVDPEPIEADSGE